MPGIGVVVLSLFQLTAARRRLRVNRASPPPCQQGFNSQPPEGGCGPAAANSRIA